MTANRLNYWLDRVQQVSTYRAWAVVYGLTNCFIATSFLVGGESIRRGSYLYRGLDNAEVVLLWASLTWLCGAALVYSGIRRRRRVMIGRAALGALILWIWAFYVYVLQLPDSLWSITNICLPMWMAGSYLRFRVWNLHPNDRQDKP